MNYKFKERSGKIEAEVPHQLRSIVVHVVFFLPYQNGTK